MGWFEALGVVGLAWIGGIGWSRYRDSRVPRLPDTFRAPDDLGLISILVPARNEERHLKTAVSTMLQQSVPRLELIVVNDHSQDRTGAIAAELAAADPRVRVVESPPLNAGWHGKPNALFHAWSAARGEWVVMTDADVLMTPDVVARAVTYAEDRGFDALSLLDTMVATSWQEMAGLPFKYLAAAMAPAVRLDRRGKPLPFANGPFILLRRELLDESFFEALRNRIPVDIGIAAVLAERGHTTHMLRGYGDVTRAHVYGASIRAVVMGIAKNVTALLGTLRQNVPRAMLLALLIVAATWLPLIALVAGAFERDPLLMAVAFASYLAPVVMCARPGPAFVGPRRFVVLYPLAALFIFAAQSIAVYYRVVRKSVLWRGRTTSSVT
jgi:chlorobactene glucosyltransferase